VQRLVASHVPVALTPIQEHLLLLPRLFAWGQGEKGGDNKRTVCGETRGLYHHFLHMVTLKHTFNRIELLACA